MDNTTLAITGIAIGLIGITITAIGLAINAIAITIAAYQIFQGNKALRRTTELMLWQTVILYRAKMDDQGIGSNQQVEFWTQFLKTAKTVYTDSVWREKVGQIELLLEEEY